MDLNLNGKRAMVCGSTAGIGKATAIELAGLGAEIVLVARNEDKLKSTLAGLPAENGQVHSYIVADFSKQDRLKEIMDQWISEKSKTIHILINNTGGPPGGPAYKADVLDFRKAFNQHLICNQIMVQAVLPSMKEAGYGRIINVISTSVKQPLDNLGVSNTIRGAVANWAKTLSNELGAFGITVNNVLPGATDTERLSSIFEAKADKTGKSKEDIRNGMISSIPVGRIGRPDEVGGAIAFLASPAAGYINGINLPVDGGRTKSL